MNRIQTLNTESFKRLAARLFNRIDFLMTDGMGYQPYGWDWPTFGVLYPRKRAAWKAVCDEAARRGIKSFPLTRNLTNSLGRKAA